MNNAGAEAPPQRDGRAHAARWLATAAIVLTPSVYSFRFTSFSDAKLAGWVVALPVLAAIVPNLSGARHLLLRRFAPLTALLALSIVLTIRGYVIALPEDSLLGRNNFVPDYASAATAVFALMLFAAALVTSAFGGRGEPRVLVALAASGVPVAALGLLQYAGLLDAMFPVFPEYTQRAYSVFGNQDLLGGYLALTLSVSLALALLGGVPRWYALTGAPAMLPALLLSGSRSAWLAAIVGCGLALVLCRPGQRWLSMGAATTLAIVLAVIALAPEATLDRVTGTFAEDDAGFRIRLWIWDGAASMIVDQPLFGVGLGNFQYHSPAYLGEALHARGPGVHLFNRIHTLHAHSDYVEVTAEAGLIGVCLLVAFFTLLPRVKSPAWAGLAAALTFSLFNTTLHSPPHVLAVLLCAAALPQAAHKPDPDPPRPSRLTRAIWLAAALAVSTGVVVSNFGPSYLLARAESSLDSGNTEVTRRAYAAAVGWPGASYEACKALAILDANLARYREAEYLAACAMFGLDTGDMRYLAGYVAEMQGKTERAAAEYAACTQRWPNHVRAWERRLALAAETDRDALFAEALPWVNDAGAERLTSLRERLRTEPVPHSAAAVP